jgi:molybdenum cofactor cytidylyltransferase
MTGKSLYAIVLAAGTASRFGGTKQLVPYRGLPLVTRAIRNAEAMCGSRSVLVTGYDWKKVAAACEPLQGFLILNPGFTDGIASSLALGVRSVSAVADAVLLMLADQPLVAVPQLDVLVKAWEASPHSICACAYAGTVGPPVIFPRCHFPALMALTGDRGARAVIESNRETLIRVHLDEAAVDIDHPADLRALE